MYLKRKQGYVNDEKINSQIKKNFKSLGKSPTKLKILDKSNNDDVQNVSPKQNNTIEFKKIVNSPLNESDVVFVPLPPAPVLAISDSEEELEDESTPTRFTDIGKNSNPSTPINQIIKPKPSEMTPDDLLKAYAEIDALEINAHLCREKSPDMVQVDITQSDDEDIEDNNYVLVNGQKYYILDSISTVKDEKSIKKDVPKRTQPLPKSNKYINKDQQRFVKKYTTFKQYKPHFNRYNNDGYNNNKIKYHNNKNNFKKYNWSNRNRYDTRNRHNFDYGFKPKYV